jgi:O-antigen/teichoic acid export membrane protein
MRLSQSSRCQFSTQKQNGDGGGLPGALQLGCDSPSMATGSVIKGSSVLIGGRVAGMAGSFLLFLLLTWRSTEVAGVFRVAVTYFTIMDFLPLLGMHRWVAAEIARRVDQQHALFEVACSFAVGVAVFCGAAYFAVASLGFYGSEASGCLRLVALMTVASAINLCSLSALVGLGYSHEAGLLSFFETLIRSSLAILLVVLGADLSSVMLVFLGARYAIAAIGYVLVRSHVGDTPRSIDQPLLTAFLTQVPNLALSAVGFLAIRNAAMLLLPLLRSESAAGLYAAPFQLFDMVLVVPTALTISTNYIFVESSRQSVTALRRSTNQLIDITALFVLPMAALGFVLARPIIETLFGIAYSASIPPLRVLLASAVVVSLDQILALSMAVSGHYQADRTCMVLGACSAVAVTCLLSGSWGATGAAVGFLVGVTCTLGLRLRLMRWLIHVPSLAQTTQGPSIAAAVAGIAVWAALRGFGGNGHMPPSFAALLAAAGSVLYCLVLYWRGGLTGERLIQVQAFMARRR